PAADRERYRNISKQNQPDGSCSGRTTSVSEILGVAHRSGRENPEDERGDQETDIPKTPLAAQSRFRLNSNRNQTSASVTIQTQSSKKLRRQTYQYCISLKFP
ncbi:hypothetical protein OEZ49_23005, partial [Ruegeria sp. WL0004]